MKKIIFLLASLVAIFTAIANNYMHVYLNNGSILDFDTDSILQVDVLKDSVTNSNYLLVVKNDSSTLRIEKSDIQKITYDDTIYKEEPVTKKDSIWGLEVKVTLIEKDDYLVRKNIQGEFYSNIKIENVDYLWCKYHDQYSTMLLNSENFKNKSKNECIMEGDSVYLVKFEWEMKVSSIAKETPFEVKLILQDGTESNELLKEVTYISEPEVFVVSFYTKDSVLIESQKVEKGKSATAVDAPVVDGYEFIGWSDSSFSNVMKDLDIYAQYKAITKDTLPVSGQIAGYDYIDLGLPSGTLWATYNVGATTPEEYGDYFAWGETKPKVDYRWKTYKWCTVDSEGWYDEFTKYNTYSDNGTVDNKTVLDAEDDAATANWGSEWRMPTNEELRELVEECQYQMTEVNGVYGAKFTGKNGNSVFFPAAGYGTGVYGKGDFGRYWSSSLYEKREDFAHDLGFSEKGVGWDNYDDRYNGFSVRAVANKTTDIEEYVVSFYTQDSVLIESQKVEKGKSATAVDAPVVDGYEFIGWSDSSFTNVMKDLDIYAQYKAITKDTLPVSGQIAGYDYIDLGLPSGILWATYNVGATKPTEYGDYFAWGETKPKEDYSWSTYKWKEGTFTKYCTDSGYGTVDNKTVLEAEDDAATANWGSAWRMPTLDEIKELLGGCDWEWTDDFNGTGVAGQVGTSKVNSAKIFLPAAGTRYGTDLDLAGSYLSYWSSSLHKDLSNSAYDFYFYDYIIVWDFSNRLYGMSVRAVANK